MNEYNTAFFNLYENWFKLLKCEYNKNVALALFKKAMAIGLSKAYGNHFNKGKTSEFARLVGERDNLVGLHVKFPKISANELIYQFHTDPFPNLKNEVSPDELDNTYIEFKIKYILGDEWHYKNTAHLWKGDAYTEFLIFKQH